MVWIIMGHSRFYSPTSKSKTVLDLNCPGSCRALGQRFAADEALRRFLVCKLEPEPYPEAHQRNCGRKNDQKGGGGKNHWATSFTARTLRPFELFA